MPLFFLHLNTFISKITRIDLLAGLEGEMFLSAKKRRPAKIRNLTEDGMACRSLGYADGAKSYDSAVYVLFSIRIFSFLTF